MITNICILLLAVVVIIQGLSIISLRKRINELELVLPSDLILRMKELEIRVIHSNFPAIVTCESLLRELTTGITKDLMPRIAALEIKARAWRENKSDCAISPDRDPRYVNELVYMLLDHLGLRVVHVHKHMKLEQAQYETHSGASEQ